MSDEDQQGDWWEPIQTAPMDGTRILLAFPAVNRPRKLGEPKPKGMNRRKNVRRGPTVGVGLCVAGQWVPGKRSPVPFFDDPTHWMYLPEPPKEMLVQAL